MKSVREMFGERIKAIRSKMGMSQKDIAKILGIDPKSFSRIETGKRSPSLDAIEQIACALDVEIQDLFEFDDQPIDKEAVEEDRRTCIKMLDKASEDDVKRLLKILRAVLR